MLTLTSNEQAQSLIKDGILAVDDDIEIAFDDFDDFEIDANIECKNIYSKDYLRNIKVWDINTLNIDVLDIKAWNINAKDIKAHNINALNINARNIDTLSINAWDINAWNINARDIKASDINGLDIKAKNIIVWNINALNIKYYALCIAYKNIHCKSIQGNRENAKHFCLEGEIFIEKEKESI